MSRQITFTLPGPYPLLNRTLRTHWSKRSHSQKVMRGAIIASLGGSPGLPSEPFQRAHIRVERWSVGKPDHDNLVGGAKALIDCLTTPVQGKSGRVRNKHGLGIVVDDSPDCITTEYHAVKCRLCEQKTVVTITEIEGGRP